MSERYETYLRRGNGIVYVSTCESSGGSLPLGVTGSPWIGETCAWDYDPAAPEGKRRGRLVFGPEYHHRDLMERHIESIRAVKTATRANGLTDSNHDAQGERKPPPNPESEDLGPRSKGQ